MNSKQWINTDVTGSRSTASGGEQQNTESSHMSRIPSITRIQEYKVRMKLLLLMAIGVVSANTEFSCIRPVNPVPAGPPGLCCQELVEYPLLNFPYIGKTCARAKKVGEAADGTTTYSPCEAGQQAACCDPLLTELEKTGNLACVLPIDST